MSVKTIINNILKKRHDRITSLEVLSRELEGLETDLDNLMTIGDRKPIPSDYVSITSYVSSVINGIQSEIYELKTGLLNLIRRFRRDTVNIGVAGKARQGKSTLLQSISGLTNLEIPTSDELPCTGAKSRIFYSEVHSHARIDYYTEPEFLKDIVYEYFERLNLPKPASLEDFSKPLPLPDDKDIADRNLYNAVYERLKIIHQTFPVFREYLSRPSETMELRQISECVTQSDGRTKYLSVKNANIFTRFPQQDVSGLCLVDLPGLEAAQGHEKKLVDSLEHEVDAVVLVKLPSAQGTQYDKDDYSVIDLIDKAVREVDLIDWLFIVLNIISDGSNEKQVNLLKSNPPPGRQFNILIGDCSNPELSEKHIFSPVLKHLAQNLDKIDGKLIKSLSEKMRNISEKISDELIKSRTQLRPLQEDRKIEREYDKLVYNFIENMKGKMSKLVNKTFNTLPDMTSQFRSKIEEICQLAEGNPIIPPAQLLEDRYLEAGGWPKAVQEELHYIRSSLSKFLADNIDQHLSELVHSALRGVLDGIFKDSNYLILASVTDETDPFKIVREIQKLFDPKHQPMLYSAFDYIAIFNFSYHSHFHHRVRSEMKRFETRAGFEFAKNIIPEEDSKSTQEVAGDIERALQVIYRETIYDISKKLGAEMQTDPGYAIFSLVEEIEDQLVRQKFIDFEWRDFLRQVRSRMWPEVFRQYDESAAFCQDWQNSVDDVLKTVQKVKNEFVKIMS